MTRMYQWLRRGAATVSAAAVALAISGPVQAQNQPQQPQAPAAKDAKDTAKDAKDSGKDAANQAKDSANKGANAAKDSANRAKDQTKDAAQSAQNQANQSNQNRDNANRDNARDQRNAQNYNQNSRDAGRDTSRDARNQRDLNAPSGSDRNANRNQTDNSRDNRNAQYRDSQNRDAQNRDSAARDNRNQYRDNQARDTQYQDRNRQSDNRDSRDSNLDSRSSSQTTFRANDVRSADIGIWFDRSANDGLVISDLSSQGAIAKVGFREGDRVISVNGQRVNRDSDFIQYLFANDVRNDRVKVIVLRDGTEEVVYVQPNVLVEEYSYVEQDPLEQFGVVIDDRYDDRIVVWKVIPRSPAYYAGIRAGDVFTTFRGQPVATRQDFVRVVTNLDAGSVPVQVRRGDRVRDYAVDVPQFQTRNERRTAMRPNVDVERPNERREGRIEDRRDNRAQDGNYNQDSNRPAATPLRPRR